jgi:hypothetical protein
MRFRGPQALYDRVEGSWVAKARHNSKLKELMS